MKKINQKLAAYVVGIALVVSPFQAEAYSGFGNKQSSTKDEISTGVSLIREHYVTSGGTPRAVQVLDVAYRNPAVDLELYQLSPLGRVQTTPQQAIANTYEGHYVVGAVNASFYNLANGIPVNMLIKQNEIINYGILSNDDGPVNAPFAFGVNRNGALTIADYEPQMSFEINGQTIPLTSVNGQRENGQAVLFTGGHQAATTGASQYATEIVVTNTSKSAKNFAFGDRITGTVSEIRRLGEGANTPIPEDGFVISANGGALAQSLAGVAVGDSITVEAQINDTWKDAEFMMATGPTLVRNGQVSISMNESGSFATSRHPRSAVGISGDGTKLFLVTIDGRQSGYSQGATLRELAEYMRSLGAYQAINLDGGGSTTMVARLPYYEQAITVNRPSESSLRAVPNTLQVISSEPPKRVTEPMLVVDPFENLNNWTASSARAEASVSLSGPYDPVRVGSKSLKLTYDYSKGESGIAAAYAKARTAIPLQGRPLELGMWASGDGAEHWLRATVIDGNGQRHTINFTEENQFNWTGWRYVRAQLPADAPQPFKVEQVYTAQGSAEKQGKGAVFFDQLEAIYQSSYQVERFKDVSSSFWARQSILALNDRNVISGYSDGSFRPGEAISREQTAIMIARALNLSAGNHRPAFNDVTSQSFYYDAIAAVDRAGIMSGKSASSFDPKATLTRAEMATILQRAYSITGQSSEPFPDVASTHWAYEAIDALKANGIAQGQPGGGFGPALPTTRAEFSVFLDRVSQ